MTSSSREDMGSTFGSSEFQRRSIVAEVPTVGVWFSKHYRPSPPPKERATAAIQALVRKLSVPVQNGDPLVRAGDSSLLVSIRLVGVWGERSRSTTLNLTLDGPGFSRQHTCCGIWTQGKSNHLGAQSGVQFHSCKEPWELLPAAIPPSQHLGSGAGSLSGHPHSAAALGPDQRAVKCGRTFQGRSGDWPERP